MDSCKNCKSSISRDSNILFCPQCGANIFDLEQVIKSRRKENIKKVSIKWQTFFSMIPFMPLLAAHRIRKLRKGAIIYTLTGVAPLFAILIFDYILSINYTNIENLALSDPTVLEKFRSFLNFYNNYWKETFLYWLGASVYLVSSLVMVYFIRKWSAAWNKEIALLQYLK